MTRLYQYKLLIGLIEIFLILYEKVFLRVRIDGSTLKFLTWVWSESRATIADEEYITH